MTQAEIANALRATAKGYSAQWDLDQRISLRLMAADPAKIEILESVPTEETDCGKTYTLIEAAGRYGKTWRASIFDGLVYSCYPMN